MNDSIKILWLYKHKKTVKTPATFLNEYTLPLLAFLPHGLVSMWVFSWFLYNRAAEDGLVIELKLKEKRFCSGNIGITFSKDYWGHLFKAGLL